MNSTAQSPLAIGGEDKDEFFCHPYGKQERPHVDFDNLISEPQGQMLYALNQWTHAQVNPKLRLELRTWDTLQLGTEMTPEEFENEYRQGVEDEEEGAALLTAAVDACRTYLAYKEQQRITGK